MYSVEFTPKAKRQILKLEEPVRLAIKTYLKEKIIPAKDKKGLCEAGGTELVGNLKGLWRFKSSEFKKYRIIAYLEDLKFIITVLTVEGRSDSYKNKEELAKKARKGGFKQDDTYEKSH
nr:type II toxin-antitoxin system RelE/ParE family toxin [uncultured Treponema sp.]